jgi:hypothetical protein
MSACWLAAIASWGAGQQIGTDKYKQQGLERLAHQMWELEHRILKTSRIRIIDFKMRS